MEKSASFDLSLTVRLWRESLGESSAFRRENLNELESHLRDSIATLQARGLSAQESFSVAAHRLGGTDLLGQEFSKVNASVVWRARTFWMVTGILAFVVGADLAAAVASALMFFGSLVSMNGFSLGWLGFAGKCAVFISALWLFRFASAGGLDRINGNIRWLFHRPALAVVMLLATTLGLKTASGAFPVASVQRLSPTTLGQIYMIDSFANFVGPLLIEIFLAVYFTRFLLQRRTSGRIRMALLSLLVPLAMQGTLSQAELSAASPTKAEKENRTTLDQAMNLWRAGKKDEAVEKFVAVDLKQRPLFPTGSVLNYSEAQFVALPEAVREKLSKEMLADIRVIKEICAHVNEAGKTSSSAGDKAKAEKNFAQLKQCGEAFDRPDSLALLQMVGKSLKKMSASQASGPKN